MKVLIVLTSHSELGDTGKKTGFWVEEFAAPYYVLADAGVELTIASPKGGQPPIDPKSEAADAQTPATIVWFRRRIWRHSSGSSCSARPCANAQASVSIAMCLRASA